MASPIIDGLNDSPPALLMDRPAFVQDGQMSTYRLMQDVALFSNPFVANSFSTGSFHNEVRYLINAEEAFPDMLAAIKTAKDKTHFVYFLNWYLSLDVSFSGAPGGGDTLKSLLPGLAAAGVQCRAMLWRNSIMAGDHIPRRVFVVATTSVPPFRLIVERFVPDAANPSSYVPPPTPTVGTLESIVSTKDVDGNVSASIFDGSRDPWWAPGLGSGPAIVAQNSAEVDFFNALKSSEGDGHCAAILDNLVPIAGAHHHKILVVNGSDGLVAFVGGIDVNNDRYTFLYDVHSHVKGPAAKNVLNIFNERWNSHPFRAGVDKGKPHLGNAIATPAERPKNVSQVQVGRTYANGNRPRPGFLDLTTDVQHDLEVSARKFDQFPGYTFAPNGVTEVWEMYKAAIGAAKRFIYIENQYFVSEQLAQALKSAVSRLSHVTLLVEGRDSDLDNDGGFSRTKKCIDILRSGDPTGKKVRVMAIKADPSIKHRYVHSKTMIVDDEYAIIGTANIARRSFNCDSEAAVGVFDWIAQDSRFRPIYLFAHRLRVRLWAELLGMNDADGHAQLADPLGAIVHWEEARVASAPLPRALVWEYEKIISGALPTPASDEEWNFARDPFEPGPT